MPVVKLYLGNNATGKSNYNGSMDGDDIHAKQMIFQWHVLN